jgi:arylsulfatase
MEVAAPVTSIRTCVAFACLAALAATACDRGPVRTPHVILISADALRRDHLSMNGHPRATSPRIDAFAKGATNFADAITPIPKTGPAFTTLFTGLTPRRHGVDANRYAIPTDLPVLAERFSAAGYATAAFVSNPVLKEIYGFSRGFASYTVFGEADALARVERAAVRWIEQAPFDRPTFLWVHLIDPHGPYIASEEELAPFRDDAFARSDPRRVPLYYDRIPDHNPIYVLGAVPSYQRLGDEDRAAHFIAAYDAEIRRMDGVFGALLDALARRDVVDDAVVVFLADHGESLGEHDYWFEHGWFAFDDSLRIPLLWKASRQRDGATVHGVASLLDVVPTVIAATGLGPAPELPGRDLVGAGPGTEPVLIHTAPTSPARYAGLPTPEGKYLRRVRPEDGVGANAPRAAEELYDLRVDPGELHDLAPQQAERVAALRAELGRRLGEAGPPPKRFAPELDPTSQEQLRALGYTQ